MDLNSFKVPFSAYEKTPDYEKLYQTLESNSNLIKTYAYFGAFQPYSDNQVEIIEKLKSIGFLVRSGKVQYFKKQNKFFKKELIQFTDKKTEILLAINMIVEAFENEYDEALLFGDKRKYEDLVNIIRNEFNKKVTVYDWREIFEKDLNRYINSMKNSSFDEPFDEKVSKVKDFITHINNNSHLNLHYSNHLYNQLKKYVYLANVQKKKVIVFIDFYNVFVPWQVKIDPIDLKELFLNIYSEDEIIEFIVYLGITYPVNRDKIDLIEYLIKLDYTVKWRYNVLLEDGYYGEEKIDILMASDFLIKGLKSSYDKAIFVSGDADFIPAIRTIQNDPKHSKETDVWGWSKTFSSDRRVKRDVENIYFLDDYFK